MVLYERHRGNCYRVVACDARRGIKPGMPLAEATSLTTADFVLHDPQADREGLLRLAAWCERFSPAVGVEGTDCLCLDASGLESLFGSETALVRQVRQGLSRLGLRARAAIADTLGAAWAVAHFGQEHWTTTRGKRALGPLPLAALRLPDELTAILAEIGIRQIGQLLKLPRPALAARFDPQLLWRLDQATGTVAEPIVCHRPRPELVAERQFENPVADRQSLRVVLSRLIEQLCRSLAERQQGLIQLECLLRSGPNEPTRILLGLYRATANPGHLLELAEMQLDRLAMPGPVETVQLAVLMTAPLVPRQQELFDSSLREGRRQVGLLIDRLSSRLGRNDVVRAVAQAEAQPELSYRYEPLTGSAPRKRAGHPPPRLPRPLRLEHEPIALEVLSVVPHGPPAQFEWHGLHRVARAWGPERIQTAWWRGRYVQRDYYRVETARGRRFWLFRRLQDGAWFLHGVFD